jgi:uncharacterized protein
VVVPVLALLIPGSVPGSVILISMPMTLTMLLREHHAIDWLGVRWILAGRIPGTVVGLLIVTALTATQLGIVVGLVILLGVLLSVVHPGLSVSRHSALAVGSVCGVTGGAAVVVLVAQDVLTTIIGVAILVAVGLSLARLHVKVSPASATTAGFSAGIMGTAAGVDGPPLALLYQHSEPHTLRATLATCFLIGAVVSGTALALGGELTGEQLELTAILLGPMLVGLALSSAVAHRIPARALRPIVLGFATVAGTVAIVRPLVGG